MQKDVAVMCDALEAFATQVTNTWGNDSTLTEALGWHCPALTRHDLASLPRDLARDLRAAAPSTLDERLTSLIQDFPRRLSLLKTHTLPQMFGGNSPQAIPAFINTFSATRVMLSPILDWQIVSDPKAMPAALARRVRAIGAELEQLAPKKEELENQIADIRRAHAAAESLPIDLQSLAEARETLGKAVEASTASAQKTATHASETESEVSELKRRGKEAEAILKQCEEAYRASTSRGLAAAFDQRATKLGWSMVAWIAGLLIALTAAVYLGADRVKALSVAISLPTPSWGAVFMHAVLSVASIGAPIWFAWLATKQIGQRFRLAEDYAFKAAVARAYEGYRKEAARIDPEFEARLFQSALTRLEEAPLRLVETSTHGSPWHELIGSDAFKKALESVPELREKFTEIARSTLSIATRGKNDRKMPEAAPSE